MKIHDTVLSATIHSKGSGGNIPDGRNACRAIIVHGQKILFTVLQQRQQYLTPGGGIDNHETYRECIEREFREELGIVVGARKPITLISEYYDDVLRFRNLYVQSDLIHEHAENRQTLEEQDLQLQGLWVEIDHLLPLLTSLQPHQALFERQPEFIRQAIACSPLREAYGLAPLFGWDIESLRQKFPHVPSMRVDVEYISTDRARNLIESNNA